VFRVERAKRRTAEVLERSAHEVGYFRLDERVVGVLAGVADRPSPRTSIRHRAFEVVTEARLC
jgi:hypothetical protein